MINMKYTLNIDTNNPNAKQLLSYIESLDFASLEKEENSSRTKELDQALEEARLSLKEGKGSSHEDVMNRMKQKYPQIF